MMAELRYVFCCPSHIVSPPSLSRLVSMIGVQALDHRLFAAQRYPLRVRGARCGAW
jgi:hypothetical protein